MAISDFVKTKGIRTLPRYLGCHSFPHSHALYSMGILFEVLPPRLSTVWNVTHPGQVLRPWVDGIEPRRKVVVAFDTVLDNFRHELYPGYKASRAEAPEDLR